MGDLVVGYAVGDFGVESVDGGDYGYGGVSIEEVENAAGGDLSGCVLIVNRYAYKVMVVVGLPLRRR